MISHDTANHPAHQRHTAFKHVSRSPVARRHANALPTKTSQIRMALRHRERSSPHGLPTHYKQSIYRTIPPIIPLTSDTPRLHQHVSRSPAPRRRANARPTKAAQIRTVRHHERNFATQSARALQAIISHDAANHPAHQRHAAFTPACFALPSGTAPPKAHFALEAVTSHDTANHPRKRAFHAPRPRKSAWRCDITNVVLPTLVVAPCAFSDMVVASRGRRKGNRLGSEVASL